VIKYEIEIIKNHLAEKNDQNRRRKRRKKENGRGPSDEAEVVDTLIHEAFEKSAFRFARSGSLMHDLGKKHFLENANNINTGTFISLFLSAVTYLAFVDCVAVHAAELSDNLRSFHEDFMGFVNSAEGPNRRAFVSRKPILSTEDIEVIICYLPSL
jgi:hypothetical protein